MLLYLIRHGESEYNLGKRHSGWAQVSLTPTGFAQAESLRPYLARIPFDKIYVSDLKRAIQTLQTAIPGCEYEQTPLLREHSSGNLIGRLFTECEAAYGEEYLRCRAAADYTPFEGENPEMVRKRVQAFLDLAASSGHETIAAFSHAGYMRTAMSCVLGFPANPSAIRAANCTVEILEYADGKWLFNSWINPAELTR